MKKVLKIILLILVLVSLIFLAINYLKTKNNAIATTTGVIVKVNEKSLTVMGTKNVTGLYTVGFAKEGNIGFEKGQEVLIYFSGIVMESYPAQLGKAGKIKIIKEESDTPIPNDRYIMA